MVLGVTGLPCSGKSYAGALIASGEVTGRKGALVKADDLGHGVLARPEVMARIAGHFGDAALASGDAAGMRRRIAERVFAHPDELAWLEALVHPLVDEEVERVIRRTGKERPVIVEAALLLAARMDERCDRVLVIRADFPARLRRAAARGWSREELERRDSRLMPLFSGSRLDALGAKLIMVDNSLDDEELPRRIEKALNGSEQIAG